MADIFVSYTSSDQDWAFWIAQQLEKFGHTAHVHEWEVSAGGDISEWMERRHDDAEHVLCVVSAAYLKAPYSSWERRAAQWVSITDRPNFVWPIFIEKCDPPTLFAPLKRCDLHGLAENEALDRLAAFARPAEKPSAPVPFPGTKTAPAGVPLPSAPVAFPGGAGAGPSGSKAISNIPITVPLHFLGRDEDLKAIDAALSSNNGRVAITALHGLRGVGKTVLAAAYAERHRNAYRATWWIRAETESTMRADLVGLAVQLGWVPADEKEEPALEVLMRRLRDDGQGLLLIYDNAINPDAIRLYVQQAGEARLIVTSNAPNWRGLAEPVEIEVWPTEVGAKFLIARAGRPHEVDAASDLSEALGGLPLAHEQAGAYCDRLGTSFTEYLKRFRATPTKFLNDERDAPSDYHDRMTVAKTFTLAIDEAAKLHPAASTLIEYAALLPAEPIPLYLFSEAREKFGPALASLIADEGLDEAVAALRTFALVDREGVTDERDAHIVTDCIRLHRLVREVASARCDGDFAKTTHRELIDALASFYSDDIGDDIAAWPRARRLDPLAIPLVSVEEVLIERGGKAASLLNGLACYRMGALGTYAEARPLLERSLNLNETGFGTDHPETARTLNNLGRLLHSLGDFAGAKPHFERALAIRENSLGPLHRDTARSLNNLGGLLREQGDLAGAKSHYEGALAILERTLGPDHPDTATSLNNVGSLLRAQGDLAGAKPYFERALGIREKALGPDHPDTARSLNNLGSMLQAQGDLAGAKPYYERALAIREKALGPDHPDTARSLNNLGSMLQAQGDLAGAKPYYERALAIREKALGHDHPDTALSLNNLGYLLQAQGDLAGAKPYFERALGIREKALGPDHPDTARSLNNLGSMLQAQGDLAGAKPYFERALAINEKGLGHDHPDTARSLNNLGSMLQAQGDLAGAKPYFERALAIREKALGHDHPDTARSLYNLGTFFANQGNFLRAKPLLERALGIQECKLGTRHPDTRQAASSLVGILNKLGFSKQAKDLVKRYGLGKS
ncbi:tetratricopeptide repeat protein [Rhodopseudomonas palustris]|uniref:tetratricopeptide repeat protein n=1 Tax=Rhodopseudomonas palustris TaxID=1076 RepID=UPI0021F36737|nr:tetratricopeptide repeat protein [Rhodopseudomonas palustris]UYO45245.1 tetratricopeptide repeat protein [Rhodopseudomonas palustris]